MNVLIVGCGRVGSRLAERLARGDHQVSVVDISRDAFGRIDPSFPGATYQGSGTDPELLSRINVGNFDIVVALTGGDNRNLMIAQMAKHQFGVQKVLARLHDPIRAARYRKYFGIETLCTTTVLEGLLELYVLKGAFPELPGEMSVAGDDSPLDMG